MTEISEQEAREAAARLFALENCTKADAWKFEHTTYESINNDERTVYMWAVQELARRDAERDEREKPIDDEWLESVGFRPSYLKESAGLWFDDVVMVNTAFSECVVCNARPSITTRGQLLDLLKALKGGE